MARKKTANRSEKPAKPAPKKRGRTRDRRSGGDSERKTGIRPLWTGHLRLALVSVPVKLYPATISTARIAFHQVHKPSGKRIRYEKVVPGIGPVDTDEIVKGFELDSGGYVLLDPEDIENLKIEAKRTLDLVQFVSQGEIDPIWFDRPYYVVSDDEAGEEAYRILRDALRASRRLGLGQFVMRGREYVGAVKPCGNGLMMETLRYADEVREAAPFFADFADEPPDRDLLKLANELIDRKTAPFEPGRFEDHYTRALRDLIDTKAKHEPPVQVDEERSEGGAKVIDLVDALKRSVRGAERGRTGGRGTGSRRWTG